MSDRGYLAELCGSDLCGALGPGSEPAGSLQRPETGIESSKSGVYRLRMRCQHG